MTDNKLSDLSYEELMNKVRQIRNGRIIPEKKKRVVKKSTERVRKSRASSLIDSLSPEQKAKLLAQLKGKES